jgi:hypothetical protein
MKNNNLNIKLEWKTILNSLGTSSKISVPPSFSVTLKDKDLIIDKFLNLNNHTIDNNKIFSSENNCKKLKYNRSQDRDNVNSSFDYLFENNFNKYKENNKKIGFYKNINFNVVYDNQDKQHFNLDVEYEMLEDIDKNILFNKIYRSDDFLSIKILSNKEYVESKGIYSYLILSTLSNHVEKNLQLKNLFIENVASKWLDNNNFTTLLTVPFIESNIVEISENINIKILPLKKWQSEMYKFLKDREKEEDINAFLTENFEKQIINIGKIYKQSINYETLVFFQNYLYLFNEESLSSSIDKIQIGDVNFENYYPILNKNLKDKMICLSEDINSDDVIDNSYNIEKDYLGYYNQSQTKYVDINMDLDYFQSRNIKDVKILEIKENETECFLYIEFITNFFEKEKFYVESSPNLKYIEKYKTLLNDREYITFLFEYKYSLEKLKNFLSLNQNLQKNQILSEKDLINFSAKFII